MQTQVVGRHTCDANTEQALLCDVTYRNVCESNKNVCLEQEIKSGFWSSQTPKCSLALLLIGFEIHFGFYHIGHTMYIILCHSTDLHEC